MKSYNELPLKKKLAIVIYSSAGLAVTMSMILFVGQDYLRHRDEIPAQLRVRARVMSNSLAAEVQRKDVNGVQDELSHFNGDRDVLLACFYFSNGQHVGYRATDAPEGTECPSTTISPNIAVNLHRAWISYPLQADRPSDGTLYVLLRTEYFEQNGPWFLAFLLGLLLLAILVGEFCVRWLVSRLAPPLADLQEKFDHVIATGTYADRASVDDGPELARLAGAFNVMLDEIEKREVELQQQSDSLMAEVAARTELNRELEAARDHAEAANRAKSHFLANMSHEIRTPMNGVIGMAELMLDTELRPEQREYLETLRLSAESLLSVINDVLDYSRIEAGKIEIADEEFELSKLVFSVAKTLAFRAHQKKLELIVDVDESEESRVHGDPHRLRQVLVNLVGNAIKFTEKGYVSLRAFPVQTAGGWDVHFVITDTGVGIPSDKLREIFHPFEQVDSSRTRRFGGTGLGLTISEKLVEKMGGQICVRSRVDEGSTFSFSVRSHGVIAKERKAENRSDEAPRILLVCDQPQMVRAIGKQCRSHGHQFEQVSSHGECVIAVERLVDEGLRMDAVLVDASLQEGGAIELAMALRRLETVKRVIVLFPSHEVIEGAARLRSYGLRHALAKPVSWPEIAAILSENTQNAIGEWPSDRTSRQRPAEPLTILVAEDNTVNQFHVRSVIEKAGHKAIVVGNGLLAVARRKQQGIDLVLMDVEMPEMNGFDATAAIVAWEKESGTEHVPIFAMTAHAMAGDRERCLEAGMDDYLTKPLHAEDLRNKLNGVQHAANEKDAGIPFDLDDALRNLDGDRELFEQLCAVFASDFPRSMLAVRGAVERRDASYLQRASHAMKSTLLVIGAKLMASTAFQLETMGRCGELNDVDTVFAKLELQSDELMTTLAAFVPPAPPAIATAGIEAR